MCSLLPEPITVGYDPDSYVITETDGSVTFNIRVFSHPTTGAPRPFTLVILVWLVAGNVLAVPSSVLTTRVKGRRAPVVGWLKTLLLIFYEMKGDVGMSVHEKERKQEDA